MDRMDFAQAATRTRVLETRLLSKARIERMVDARDIEEVFKILAETEYQESLAGTVRGEDYEKVLSNELRRVYKIAHELTRETSVIELLSLRYDYHNLKVLIKETALKSDLSEMYVHVGTSDFSKIKSAFITGELKNIDPRFRNALVATAKDFEATKDPQRIDMIIDQFYFQHLIAVAEETKIPLFVEYVKSLIDFTNVKTLVRIKKLGKDMKFLEEVIIENGNIPKENLLLSLNEPMESIMNRLGGFKVSDDIRRGLEAFQRTQRLSEFERILDNYLMKLNMPSKYVVFGPEPIFSYIVAKEAEIKALRIIMVSKLNKLSPESIRERLRELYV